MDFCAYGCVLFQGMLSLYNSLSEEGKSNFMLHIVHHTILVWKYYVSVRKMLPVEMRLGVLFWLDDAFM